MGKVQQHFLIYGIAAALLLDTPLWAKKFYDDDPLWQMPKPLAVEKAKRRKLNEYYDFFLNTFTDPGEVQLAPSFLPSQAINTLGEVPDSAWYTNRHWMKRLSIPELKAGPGINNAPDTRGPWKVLRAKSEGITPGFEMEDAKGRRYLVKFDPEEYPDLATGADVVGSKFFHALGYNVPENYIVHFDRSRLTVGEKASIVDLRGRERPMKSRDIDDFLLRSHRNPEREYRAIASYFVPGELIGPFRFHRVRKDDPNDVVAHENRRDLRGLFVFAAWLAHNDIKSLNTLDSIIEEGGTRYIRHYLIDFGATLGSDSFEPKSPRAGNAYLFGWKQAASQFFSLGLYVPKWARANFPDIPSVGNLEYEVFDPDRWKPNYPNPAFNNRLPTDELWAAKQVVRFTDEEIRAVVETGMYSDPRAVDWITKCLIERRNKIGRTFLAKVLPLDNFRIESGRLAFDDIAAMYNYAQQRKYTVRWSTFDNDSEQKADIAGHAGFEVPDSEAAYLVADINAGDAKTVAVYVRNSPGRTQVVGVERTWEPSDEDRRRGLDAIRNDRAALR